MKSNTFIKGLFLLTLAVLASCGTSSKEGALTSDQYDSTTASAEPSSASSRKSYRPLTGHMDHVEYYINKDLMQNGLEPEDRDFAELRSTFESSGRSWSPSVLKGYNIPVIRNEKVERWIRYFTGPLRPHFQKWLSRSSLYAPVMEQVLKQYGMPTDLIYLSMIESGFNMHAYSRAHASGPWQFIRSTGRMYGLSSGGMVDERRDLLKATRAAAEHLRDLYKTYGDWYLAFAAYNAGSGTVNRAIARGGSRNFWALTADRTRYFRQETKDYVPRILAAAIVSKNYRQYGFSPNLFDRPLNFEVVNVSDSTDVEMIAQCAGTNVDEVRFLNPSLVMGVTPPNQSYAVLVPGGSGANFKKNYAKLSRSDRARFAIHKVRAKETPAAIAKQYKVPVQRLIAFNKALSNPKQKLVRGSTVVVPSKNNSLERLDRLNDDTESSPSFAAADTPHFPERSGAVGEESWDAGKPLGDERAIATLISKSEVVNSDSFPPRTTLDNAAVAEKPSIPVSTPKTYHVRRGDTLGKIAARYGVAVLSLRQWNDMGPRESLKAGQVLKIESNKEPAIDAVEAMPSPQAQAPEKPSTYRVDRGDTLGEIAQKHGVSVAALKALNGMGSREVLKAGQVLRLSAASGRKDARKVAVLDRNPSFPPKAAPVPSSDRLIIHSVRRGETLTDISRRYRVPIELIRKWNSLTSHQIQPNQRLKIYSQIGISSDKVASASH